MTNSAFRVRIRFPHGPARLIVAATVIGGTAFAQRADTISAGARQQIADILAIKDTFTPAEKKMSSNLVMLNRQSRGLSLGAAAGLVNARKVNAGMVQIDVRAKVSLQLLQSLATQGGQIENHSAPHGHIRMHVPVTALHTLAEDPNVLFIREAEEGTCNVGVLTSQGYIAHRAKSVVESGIDGTGVKVGVMSDSASAAGLAALIASGDLGTNTTVLAGQSGTGSDEGTAMMEIVQDIAPGAQVYFATANGSQATMASNIAALAASGCTIIVDDYTYYAEAAFQDGTIAQAVNAFVAGGGLYFSSAANSGNVSSGTSGTWEGDYLDGGAVSSPVSGYESGRFHNFGTSGSPILYDTLTVTTSYISLKWSDPLGASANDYDLFVLNSAGTSVKAFSMTYQTGTQDPIEILSYSTSAVGDRIVVVSKGGSARALRVDTNRGALSIGTRGSTFGHNAGSNTVTVAATDWGSARSGVRAFDGTNNPIETFSSDGPRRIFYYPDGTAITPGNVLFATGGGTNLPKPDVTAADGVCCKTTGFLPFFGTSAAAPHAAGVAALVKSARPTLTSAQIRKILTDTALDNMAPGIDSDGGHGVIAADAAVNTALTY